MGALTSCWMVLSRVAASPSSRPGRRLRSLRDDGAFFNCSWLYLLPPTNLFVMSILSVSILPVSCWLNTSSLVFLDLQAKKRKKRRRAATVSKTEKLFLPWWAFPLRLGVIMLCKLPIVFPLSLPELPFREREACCGSIEDFIPQQT